MFGLSACSPPFPQYLEMRFDSRAVRRMASLMFVLQTLLYEAVAIYAPALALAAVTNMPVWVSILTVAAIGSVYTAIVSEMMGVLMSYSSAFYYRGNKQ